MFSLNCQIPCSQIWQGCGTKIHPWQHEQPRQPKRVDGSNRGQNFRLDPFPEACFRATEKVVRNSYHDLISLRFLCGWSHLLILTLESLQMFCQTSARLICEGWSPAENLPEPTCEFGSDKQIHRNIGLFSDKTSLTYLFTRNRDK